MRKTICYLLSLGLFTFYLVVLCTSGKRNASWEYEKFYIDQDLKYYVSEQELQQYTADQLWEYNQNGQSLNLGKGWSGFEDLATWMEGEESSFYIWLDSVQEKPYQLKISTLRRLKYKREFYVNGEKVDFPKAKKGIYTVEIPAEYLKEGLNEFTIVTRNVQKYCDIDPESSDTRLLTMFVKSVELCSGDEEHDGA